MLTHAAQDTATSHTCQTLSAVAVAQAAIRGRDIAQALLQDLELWKTTVRLAVPEQKCACLTADNNSECTTLASGWNEPHCTQSPLLFNLGAREGCEQLLSHPPSAAPRGLPRWTIDGAVFLCESQPDSRPRGGGGARQSGTVISFEKLACT